MQKKHIYDFPEYYDLSFSFRDIPRESKVFDTCIERYSLIPVRSVLEIGAGTAPHMEEWARRGIGYVGIDMNENMLSYARKKAQKLKTTVSLQHADMRNFSLGKTVDFAYIMLGSLFAKTTQDIDSHFRSVAKALKPGGLYFLDWCVNFQWPDASEVQTWIVDKGTVKLQLNFRTEVLNRADQMVRNTLTAKIDNEGKMLELETIDVVRTIFPQEFLLLVEKSKNFEFVGWWNNWDLEEPIGKAVRIRRPITLLRRINPEQSPQASSGKIS